MGTDALARKRLPGEFGLIIHGKKNFDAPEIRSSGILFPGKGWPVRGSLIVGSPEKSPVSIAGETVNSLYILDRIVRVPSKLPKKKVLFLPLYRCGIHTGPPPARPNWF